MPTTPIAPVPDPTRVLLAAAGLALAPAAAIGQGDPLSEPFPAVLELMDLDGTIGFKIAGEEPRDRIGSALAPAGDINGDGIDDIIIAGSDITSYGVPYFRATVHVVFGRDGTGGRTFPAAIGAGAVADGVGGFVFEAGPGFGFNRPSVASAGDLNGDGVDDIIVGAPRRGAGSAGSSYVIFGRDTASAGRFAPSILAGDLDGTNGFRIDGASSEYSGWSVSGRGDFNGDGLGDVVIGAVGASPGGRVAAGSTFVVFGRDGSASPAFPAVLTLASLDGATGFRLDGVQATDRSGYSVASAGDLNGDGIDDIIIGMRSIADPSRTGTSYVVFGRDGSGGPAFAPTAGLDELMDGVSGFRLIDAEPYDRSGRTVASAGDVNGDGLGDIIIGAHRAGPETQGAAFVAFGRDGSAGPVFPSEVSLADLDGATGFRVLGAARHDYCGWSVASAADLNGDGIDDIIIGARGASPGGETSAGSTYVVFGRDASVGGVFPASIPVESLDGHNGLRLDGSRQIDRSGNHVASAGDINGDGTHDVIIGAYTADPSGRLEAGIANVIFGRSVSGCTPDLDGDGALTIFDFLAFGNLFDLMDPRADFDGDGDFTIFDFLAFQNAFDAGCP